MDFFIQQLVNGLTLGSLYALLALGYSIVYGVLGLLNFAQGEVYMQRRATARSAGVRSRPGWR